MLKIFVYPSFSTNIYMSDRTIMIETIIFSLGMRLEHKFFKFICVIIINQHTREFFVYKNKFLNIRKQMDIIYMIQNYNNKRM